MSDDKLERRVLAWLDGRQGDEAIPLHLLERLFRSGEEVPPDARDLAEFERLMCSNGRAP